MNALEEIAAERQRQIDAEGWTPDHDDEHIFGELPRAAACYAAVAGQAANDHRHGVLYPPATWPWKAEWWKPSGKRRMLVKAAALIVAEIERIDRAMQSLSHKETMG